MILLDTNIISELMKPNPSSDVITWMDQQEAVQLFISTVTVAEISYGISILPNGNRRRLLETAFGNAIIHAFEYRILSFDEAAAYAYAKIMSQRKKLGKPMSVPDGQIAAIASANRFAVATRDLDDFSNCWIDLINPFEL